MRYFYKYSVEYFRFSKNNCIFAAKMRLKLMRYGKYSL